MLVCKGGGSQYDRMRRRSRLLAVPHLQGCVALDLLLQLEEAVKERLGSGRASRHVNVDGHDPITPAHNRIRVVVVPATVGTAVMKESETGIRYEEG